MSLWAVGGLKNFLPAIKFLLKATLRPHPNFDFFLRRGFKNLSIGMVNTELLPNLNSGFHFTCFDLKSSFFFFLETSDPQSPILVV